MGDGNVRGTYLASSDVQSDSPHTMNGRSNSLGNNSGSSATNPFVSYRGIENPWGNAWQWIDGVNILEHQLWVSNDETLYNDNDETGYVKLGAPLPSGGWIKEWQKIANGFLPAVTGDGAGAATFIGDYLYTSAGRRALLVGGSARMARLRAFAARVVIILRLIPVGRFRRGYRKNCALDKIVVALPPNHRAPCRRQC